MTLVLRLIMNGGLTLRFLFTGEQLTVCVFYVCSFVVWVCVDPNSLRLPPSIHPSVSCSQVNNSLCVCYMCACLLCVGVCWSEILAPPSFNSQAVYNTKGTRAHTHRELIRKWLWEPKGSYSHLCFLFTGEQHRRHGPGGARVRRVCRGAGARVYGLWVNPPPRL